ncbi:DUF397 domain-containing protein [Streptomyces sp. 5-10]|uniref:DUF397 domain-containing protein n=1 Tax=Streptomyces sp. 5-10 TaxID=878925 RepID=UPI00168B0033|nr:DUF397 domain-containing protein [Streptomyces sp. 5-10]MBD3003233.1 DUF397 domain-containing protein [Streptomyces sp. 5-10]
MLRCLPPLRGSTSGRQAVRDTKDRERGTLLFEPSAWQAFVNAVRDGEFGG